MKYAIKLCLLYAIGFLFGCVLGVFTQCSAAESWLGVNGAGCRSYSPTALGAAPAVAWVRTLDNFPSANFDPYKSGRRAFTPLIADGKVWVILPEGTASNVADMSPAVVAQYSLADGTEVKRFTTAMNRTGVQRTNAGSADCDFSGVYWYKVGSNIIATAGGDHPGKWCFDAETGAAVVLPGLPASICYNSNSSAMFAAHGNLIMFGGNSNHSSFGGGGGARLDVVHEFSWNAWKSYNIGPIHPQQAYPVSGATLYADTAYRFGPMVDTQKSGVRVLAIGAAPQVQRVWVAAGYEDKTHNLYSTDGNDGRGAPRPICTTPNGKIAYLAYPQTTTLYGTYTFSVGDYGKGSILTILDPVPTAAVGMIPGFVSYKLLAKHSQTNFPNAKGAMYAFPQLGATNTHVVAFIPPSPYATARLFAVDVASKAAAWEVPYTSGTFRTACNTDTSNRGVNQAVQFALAGNEAVVVEPQYVAGVLSLHIIRHNLADGKITSNTNHALAMVPAMDTSWLALREVAAVDGALVVLLDYKPTASSPTTQVLAVLK